MTQQSYAPGNAPVGPIYPVNQHAWPIGPMPQTFQTPIEQSRALRLVSPFKTGFLVGLGIICASLVPLGILLIIVASVASNSQPQTF